MRASLASFSRISVRTSTHSPSFGAGCTPRSYRNSVALPRITLRTVARDTDSVLTISLIGKCRSKNARRIWPILSTPIIPISSSRPPQATEGDIDETSEGSRLDAKNPPQGVIIASEFTLGRSRGGFSTKAFVIVDGSGRAIGFALAPGQANELPMAPVLLSFLTAVALWIVADRGYSSHAVRMLIRSLGARPAIPTRRNEAPVACPPW